MGGRRHRGSLLGLLGLLALGLVPVVRGEEPAPPAAAPPRVAPVAAPGTADPLVVGEFTLADDPVVDGDTFRLSSPKENVRVACVDTEEVFHGTRDPVAAEADFPAYAKARRAGSPLPVKYPTPLGEAARAWAQVLLAGVRTVRLERDEPGRDRDGYGRRLAHVFVVRDGGETLVAEALIREGLSPYFVKYGRSRRFDARLRRAQEEARAGKRGIWSPDLRHYPDYDERLAWWEERARQVDDWFLQVAREPTRRDLVRLGETTAPARLAEHLGKSVTVFGSLDRVEAGGTTWPGRPAPGRGVAPRPPSAPGTKRRILLVDQPRAPLVVVVPEDGDATWEAIPFESIARRMVRVTGVVQAAGTRFEIRVTDARHVRTD